MVMDWSNSTFNSKMEMIGRPSIVNLQSAYVANTKLAILLDQNEYQISNNFQSNPNQCYDILFAVLPAAVFHGLLYNSDLPKYYNYGGLGSIIGLDLVRNLHLSIKSSRELYEGFEENKKCMIESLEQDNVNCI
jgi:ATP-dependent Zn protease